VLPPSVKKRKTDNSRLKDRRKLTEKNEEIHAQNSTFRKKRTNQPHKSFFAGRAVSLPTREQKLVSLGF
jgi:hypothetical protein